MAGSNREIKIGNATPNDILAIALEKGLSEEKAKEMFALAQAQADEERTKQERKTELQEEKAEDKKDAFDALAVEVDNKLRGKQFDEASKADRKSVV